MRTSQINRETNETKISLYINLDGTGQSTIDTGIGFFNHMLTLFSKHSGYDLNLTCRGDIDVDYHHSVEDVGIVLGQAICEALGKKRGIRRYGNALIPMDEALVQTAVDISGRSFLVFGLEIPSQKVGNFDTELVEEFFSALTREAKLTLNMQQISGKNSHHIIEAAFKSFARAMRAATEPDPRFSDAIPSTKGAL